MSGSIIFQLEKEIRQPMRGKHLSLCVDLTELSLKMDYRQGLQDQITLFRERERQTDRQKDRHR